MEPSPLVYDTAAAALIVASEGGPALPAYDAAPCPAGACCPLPRRETDSEAMLGGLIAEGAALYAACRRCAVPCAPAEPAGAGTAGPGGAAGGANFTAGGIFSACLVEWRQPPAPAARVRETWLAALRRVYVGEAVVQRGCADLAARMEDGCPALLAAEADRAAERGKRLANLLEKALTTENNLLKW